MKGVFLTPTEVPDGPYTGKWSGYTIEFQVTGKPVYVTTSIGVRGMNIPVRFVVRDGTLDESSIVT